MRHASGRVERTSPKLIGLRDRSVDRRAPAEASSADERVAVAYAGPTIISVPADVISRLKAVLGEGDWSQDRDRIAPKLVEWRGRGERTTPLLGAAEGLPIPQYPG